MTNDTEEKSLIKTSAPGWLKQVADFYKSRKSFTLVDDAAMGIDPREDTLLKMGLKARLSKREWSGVLLSLGIAGVGAWLLVLAVIDPEPFSKVTATILSGAILFGAGGMMAIRILTNIRPPSVRVDKKGYFEIFWS